VLSDSRCYELTSQAHTLIDEFGLLPWQPLGSEVHGAGGTQKTRSFDWDQKPDVSIAIGLVGSNEATSSSIKSYYLWPWCR
jgi:hypothetical protein